MIISALEIANVNRPILKSRTMVNYLGSLYEGV